jgi:rubrerythrin
MERDAQQFYLRAATRSTEVATRELLGDLAAAEPKHEATASELERKLLDPETRRVESASFRRQLNFLTLWPTSSTAVYPTGGGRRLATVGQFRS